MEDNRNSRDKDLVNKSNRLKSEETRQTMETKYLRSILKEAIYWNTRNDYNVITIMKENRESVEDTKGRS